MHTSVLYSELTTNTVNGISTTQLTSSFINDTYASGQDSLVTPGKNEYNTDKSLGGGAIYTANVGALLGQQEYFSNAFAGSYGDAVGTSNGDPYGEPGNDNETGVVSRSTTSPGSVIGEVWSTNGSTTISDIAGGMFNAIGISSNNTDRQAYPNNTKAMMNNIATSLTNNIRQGADPLEYATGKAYKDQTTVVVRWLWIISPASLLFLSLLILIGTIIHSSQVKTRLWKSSITALMQSLSDDGRRALGSLDCTSRMDARTSKIEVSLGGKKKGRNY